MPCRWPKSPLALVLLALLGCGTDPPSPTAGDDGGSPQSGGDGGAFGDSSVQGGDGCVPPSLAVTCAKKCGTVVDACGISRNCGGCAAPATCGGGGQPGVCGCISDGKNPCEGKTCGTAFDSCGAPVVCGPSTCGDAGTGATCGGGGVPNVCGCTPLSQAAACSRKDCGAMDDGCGGTISCGTCDTGVGLFCCKCAGGSWGCTIDVGGCMACGG